MKKIVASTLTLAVLALGVQTAIANSESKNIQQVAAPAPVKVQNQKTWLGVSLAPVPTVLSKQLGNIIPENQGVMIRSISPDSPASKAGLQAYDILLSFNDQQLYSAQQLAGLVASSKADDEIKLSLVRNGQKQETSVKLAAHAIANYRQPPFGFNHQPFARPLAPMPFQGVAPSIPSGQKNVMQQFESISINKTGDGKVRAEVSFENNGDKKEFVYEGKYDEVRKQIQESKELPDDKKNSLLNALKNNPNQLLSNGFGNMPAMPSFRGFFSDPFFNNDPFFSGRSFNGNGFYNAPQPQQAPSWFSNGQKL